MVDKLQRRIEKYTTFTSGCWLWEGCKDKDGYARVGFMYRDYRVHRLMYQFCRGYLPSDLVIDHLCRVRNCINPYHLEAVTNEVNLKRGERATATHCKKGHPYDEINTRRDRDGFRICIECATEYHKEYMQNPINRDRKNAYKREWRARGGAVSLSQ